MATTTNTGTQNTNRTALMVVLAIVILGGLAYAMTRPDNTTATGSSMQGTATGTTATGAGNMGATGTTGTGDTGNTGATGTTGNTR